jgi:hypothetical protein
MKNSTNNCSLANVIYCEFADRKFVSEFGEKEGKCDVLINNAGIMNCRKMLTEDGIEMQLGKLFII